MLEKRVVLGELEVRILNALWELGQATVQDVVDHLRSSGDGESRHYNTCSTVLSRLAKRGLVRRDAAAGDSRTLVFEAAVSREALGRSYLDRLRDDLFGGSLHGLVSALLGPGQVSEREERRIRKLVDAIEGAAPEPAAEGDDHGA